MKGCFKIVVVVALFGLVAFIFTMSKVWQFASESVDEKARAAEEAKKALMLSPYAPTEAALVVDLTKLGNKTRDEVEAVLGKGRVEGEHYVSWKKDGWDIGVKFTELGKASNFNINALTADTKIAPETAAAMFGFKKVGKLQPFSPVLNGKTPMLVGYLQDGWKIVLNQDDWKIYMLNFWDPGHHKLGESPNVHPIP